MLGAQIKGLQLQTLAPDLFNTWALQMPLGVWICRAQGGLGWQRQRLVLEFGRSKNHRGIFSVESPRKALGGTIAIHLFFMDFFRGYSKPEKLELHVNLQNWPYH